ncbi:MAG: hypothetical protein J0M30_01865 [Chitinophagales bacterium]|nr:hypothetical protein [Chitinophagales bacterium]
MKKFLPMITLLFGSYLSSAQGLVLSENFGGYTSGDINGQGGWTVTSTTSQVQVANVAPYLAYPGYVSGTQYVNISATSSRYARKNFITNIPLNASAVVYMSFVVRIASTPNSNEERVVVLKDEAGNDVLRFFVDRGGATSRVRFGIGTGSEGAVYTPSGASNEYAVNTNYLIVIRYDIDASATNRDDIYMWVNPSLASEPTTASANVSNANVNIDYTFGTTNDISQLEIPKRTNTPTGSLDAFKIAYGSGNGSTALNAAAAWSDLSPAGIALPVSFGDIRGSIKGNTVKIDWTILTEVNVKHYAVERSVNGRDFEEIGTVAALKKGAYSLTDISPVQGANYYRIRNLDIDGSSSISNVVKVVFGKKVASLTLFPNPVSGDHVSVLTPDLAKGMYTIRMLDQQGAQLSRTTLIHDGGSLSQTIRVPEAIKGGMYTLEISDGLEVRIYKQFILVR